MKLNYIIKLYGIKSKIKMLYSGKIQQVFKLGKLVNFKKSAKLLPAKLMAWQVLGCGHK